MAQTQTGIAVIWGITTADTANAQLLPNGAGVGIGTNGRWRHTGQNYGREADTVEHKEKDGRVVGVTTFNQRETMELTVYPSAATLAHAKEANILPQPGSKIIIVDPDDSDVGASSTGKAWYVASASKVKSTDDKVVFTVSCRRWDGIGSSATPETGYDPTTTA